MAISTAATVTSLDGFHATSTAQRADELVRAFFDAVNTDEQARIDELNVGVLVEGDLVALRTIVTGTHARLWKRRRDREPDPDLHLTHLSR